MAWADFGDRDVARAHETAAVNHLDEATQRRRRRAARAEALALAQLRSNRQRAPEVDRGTIEEEWGPLMTLTDEQYAEMRADMEQVRTLTLTVEQLIYIEAALHCYYDTQVSRGNVLDRLVKATWASIEHALYGYQDSEVPSAEIALTVGPHNVTIRPDSDDPDLKLERR